MFLRDFLYVLCCSHPKDKQTSKESFWVLEMPNCLSKNLRENLVHHQYLTSSVVPNAIDGKREHIVYRAQLLFYLLFGAADFN